MNSIRRFYHRAVACTGSPAMLAAIGLALALGMLRIAIAITGACR